MHGSPCRYPLVAETLAGTNALTTWCVMVQREVADRFFAEPGSKAYGAVSVLVRLHARRTGFHPVSRTVFRPPPNVDSALVAFTRSRRRPTPTACDASSPERSAIVGRRWRTRSRSQASPRERSSGRARRDRAAANIRAEALEPAEFVALADALAA